MSHPHNIRRRGRDAGSGTLIGMLLILLIIALATTLVETGNQMRASAQATDIAQQAARAGANQLDLTALRTDGTVQIDPTAARTAAMAYLAQVGATGTVTATPTRVSVAVTITRPRVLLPLVGVRALTVTSTADAQPLLT